MRARRPQRLPVHRSTPAAATSSTITIDLDAAGWGWSLAPGAIDQNRIDLFSVLTHEVGHVLGHEHTATGVMAETIEPGTTFMLGSQPTGGVPFVGAAAHAVERRVGGALETTNVPDRVFYSAVRAVAPIVAVHARRTASNVVAAATAVAQLSLDPVTVMVRARSMKMDAIRVIGGVRGPQPVGAPAPLSMQLGLLLAALALVRRRRIIA